MRAVRSGGWWYSQATDSARSRPCCCPAGADPQATVRSRPPRGVRVQTAPAAATGLARAGRRRRSGRGAGCGRRSPVAAHRCHGGRSVHVVCAPGCPGLSQMRWPISMQPASMRTGRGRKKSSPVNNPTRATSRRTSTKTRGMTRSVMVATRSARSALTNTVAISPRLSSSIVASVRYYPPGRVGTRCPATARGKAARARAVLRARGAPGLRPDTRGTPRSRRGSGPTGSRRAACSRRRA